MVDKRVSILAIGNEILLGQIINKNAAYISEKLLDYNLRVFTHFVVADDIGDIVAALNYLWDKSDIIITTGGLGPTEDDLTRQALSQFLKTSMHQDENVLKELKQKLQKREVQFTLNHIRQAQFPSGSRVMRNDVGTADGFHCSSHNKDIFSFPGPWQEIQSCWENYVHEKLKGIALQKIQLERYQILGLPESEISSRVEKILKGSPFSAEYRIHQPYVEVRIDVSPLNSAKWSNFDKLVQEEFQNLLVGKGNIDNAASFIDKIKDKKVLFVDAASQGYLGEKMLPLIKGLNFDFFQIASLPAAYAADNYEVFFEIHPVNDNEWLATINNSEEIPIRRLTQRTLRPEALRRKLSEIFFWRILDYL
jgi:nicotinamide-nucleotide amidase